MKKTVLFVKFLYSVSSIVNQPVLYESSVSKTNNINRDKTKCTSLVSITTAIRQISCEIRVDTIEKHTHWRGKEEIQITPENVKALERIMLFSEANQNFQT